MKITDFDDVFPYIGGFGLYQYIIFGLVCAFNILFCFIYFGQIFMTLTPPHWCAPPVGLRENLQVILQQNITDEEFKDLTIPKADDGISYSKCFIYNITINNTYNASDYVQRPELWESIPCDNGWIYNYSMYYPTLTSQLNWVCEEDWKPPLAQSCFFIGSMIGVPIFGWLADRFGRIPIIVTTNLMGGLFGLASSFSNSFILFCILRFIVGLAHDSSFYIIYILGLEYVSAPYRSIVANVPILLFLTATMCATPWIAYAIHDWTWFGVAIHTPFLLCIFTPWVAPESARWLISKGKLDKAADIIQHAAKVNRKELSKEFLDDFKEYASKASEKCTETVYFHDLLKTPKLRKRFLILCIMWISIFLAYDGHVRITESIGSNVFVSFTLMGAVELPGDLITIFCMEWFGRRHTTVWSLIFSGLAAMSIMLLKKSETVLLLAFAVSGRFLITMAINVGQQYIIEILPTAGRAQGSAAIHTAGLGMAFVSPYIVYLAKFHHWLPYLIFGIISIMGGLFCLMLPETIGEKLPDSLQDGEDFFKNQPFCYNPCAKKHDETIQEKYTRRSSTISRTGPPVTKVN